jgi:DsbC/DsbD-like thiol-disulfide interchange protein
MNLRQFQIWLLAGVSLSAAATAQGPIQPVKWTGSIATKTLVDPGHKAAIEIAAEIQEGWHVYGLDQVSGGPTPLRAALDLNEVVQTAGKVTGTEPIKLHDTSFNLETQVYTHSFTLQIPVQIKRHLTAGKQSVSVSVHFQACSDRICLPPKTVHVTVPIEISPGS